MSRFRKGERVVALVDDQHPKYFSKGDIVTVQSFCEGTNYMGVMVDGIYIEESPYPYGSSYFAPLTSSTDAIEYKVNVSIPELLELTKLQEA